MIGAIFIKFGRAPTTFRIFTIVVPPLCCDAGTVKRAIAARLPPKTAACLRARRCFNKDELIAPQADAAAFQFDQCEAALAVKVENLFGRRELIWVTADPIYDVVPAAHAAKVVRRCPRAQIFAGTAVERAV